MSSITYGLLCKYLLEECGVDSKVIIKHRFALGFIAKAARAMPTEVSNQNHSFLMVFENLGRRVIFVFNRLSNQAIADSYIREIGGTWSQIHPIKQRPTEAVINCLFAEIYPLTEPAPKAWYVRAWEWVQHLLNSIVEWSMK